jgi:hypothetical protein
MMLSFLCCWGCPDEKRGSKEKQDLGKRMGSIVLEGQKGNIRFGNLQTLWVKLQQCNLTHGFAE